VREIGGGKDGLKIISETNKGTEVSFVLKMKVFQGVLGGEELKSEENIEFSSMGTNKSIKKEDLN
jgi:hypothetical protein